MNRILFILLCLIVCPVGCTDDLDGEASENNQNNQDKPQECVETEVPYTLSGNVMHDDYSSGTIELSFIEDASSMCGEVPGTILTETPGNLLGKVTLDAPGPFEVSLQYTRLNTGVVMGGNPSGVIILATHNPDADRMQCEGAAVTVVPQENQSNIQLNLAAIPCPVLF